MTAGKLKCCNHINPDKITKGEIDALKKRNLFKIKNSNNQVITCDSCAEKIRSGDSDDGDGLLENIASAAIGFGLGALTGGLLGGLFGSDDNDNFSGGGGDSGGGGSSDDY